MTYRVKDMPACKGCPFYQTGEQGFVPDEINTGAKLAIIAQNPGELEELDGRPLIGRSGQMVIASLGTYGIKREDASWLNVLKCRWQNENILPREENILRGAVDHCTGAYLRQNLARIRPNLYVPMGDLALHWLTGRENIGHWRGSVFIADSGPIRGSKVLPTIHPAAIFRQPAWRSASKSDFSRIARELPKRELVVTYSDVFHLGVSAEEFINTIAALKGPVVLDIETKSTRPKSERKPIEETLAVIGIGWGKDVAANYVCDAALDEVLRAIESADVDWIAGGAFDFTVLTHYGVKFKWERCHDLILLHSRFDIELPHSIEFIASMWTDRAYWKHLTDTDLLLYNALDCAAEWEAWYRLAAFCKARAPLVWKVYMEDRPLIEVQVALHLAGMPTERGRIQAEKRWYEKERETAEKALLAAFGSTQGSATAVPVCATHKRYTGKSPLKARKGEAEVCSTCAAVRRSYIDSQPLNLRSRPQMIRKLRESGIRVPLTREGKTSLAKGVVSKLLKKYNDPRLAQLLNYWSKSTAVSRYFKEAWISPATGRIHSVYSMHSAKHRWSCQKPNMQQTKRPEKVLESLGDIVETAE